MSVLLEVTPSGTVGRIVAAATKKVYLRGLTVTPSAANVILKIRNGVPPTVSAEVVYFARVLSAQGSFSHTFSKPMPFTKGMHVAVTGALATAYLELD